jgi:hypothetical protein
VSMLKKSRQLVRGEVGFRTQGGNRVKGHR